MDFMDQSLMNLQLPERFRRTMYSVVSAKSRCFQMILHVSIMVVMTSILALTLETRIKIIRVFPLALPQSSITGIPVEERAFHIARPFDHVTTNARQCINVYCILHIVELVVWTLNTEQKVGWIRITDYIYWIMKKCIERCKGRNPMCVWICTNYVMYVQYLDHHLCT